MPRFQLIRIITILSALCFTGSLQADALTLYSSRNASYLTPLLNAYSSETGVAVNYLIDSPEALINKLESEEEKKQADVLLLTGAHHLVLASLKGVLASVSSSYLHKVVPSHLRSRDSEWFALSKRAEAIAYHPDLVDEASLSTYAALADSTWHNTLCLRPAQSLYNQSLLAGLTLRLGKDEMPAMLKGWRANLVVNTPSDDLAILEAIEQKRCALGVVYAYYLPRHTRLQPNSKIKLFWPDQNAEGVHIDITGAGVVANSERHTQAVHLLEWLLSKKAQAMFVRLTMEYPVHRRVYPDRKIARHGTFKESQVHMETISAFQHANTGLVKQAGF